MKHFFFRTNLFKLATRLFAIGSFCTKGTFHVQKNLNDSQRKAIRDTLFSVKWNLADSAKMGNKMAMLSSLKLNANKLRLIIGQLSDN